MSCILAMVLYPDIQRRAQETIDEVCQGRLPDFSDYSALPYVHALVRESLRWNPVAALSALPFSLLQCMWLTKRPRSAAQVHYR